MRTRAVRLLTACLLGTAVWAIRPLALAAPTPATDGSFGTQARLKFIAQLFAEHDDYRAESEILSYLREAPNDPHVPEVELARAKLYYRAGRYSEADAMLISILDRVRSGPVAVDARRLLGFSWMRQGRLDDATPLLAGEPALDPLRAKPPFNPSRAVAWSSGLPGAGFFTLDEPSKGATALAVNLVFIAGAVIAYQQHNVPAALIFASIEGALYTGGRNAVREEAQRLNENWLRERRGEWLSRSSEPKILGAAFSLNF